METKRLSTVRGFTIVELLTTVAIIGVLSSLVFSGVGYARGKAKVAAFKAEIRSLSSNLISRCDTANLGAGDVTAAGTHSAGTIVDGACMSDATFQVTFTSTNGASCTSASVNETGVVFTGC